VSEKGERHVWSLGGGVTVEMQSNAPLAPKHWHLLARYIALATEAAATAPLAP
jgi:hypothetical protein